MNKTFAHLENLLWDGIPDNYLSPSSGVDDYLTLVIAAGDGFLTAGTEGRVEIKVYP